MKRIFLVLLMVAMSLTAHAQTISNIRPLSLAATLSAANAGTCSATTTACAVLLVGGYSNVSVQVTGNASANTLQFEMTLDALPSASSTWVAVNLTPPNSVTPVTSTTATGLWFGPANASAVRVRMSTLVGGTAVVTIRATFGTAARNLGGGSLIPTTFAVGDLLYADTTTTLAKLPDVAVGQLFSSGGVNAAPSYTANPTITGVYTSAAGTAAAPNYRATGALTTGLAITATPSWILGVGGAAVLTGTSTAVTVDNAATLGWADAFFTRLAANITAQRNGTATQEFDFGPSGSDIRFSKTNGGDGFIITRDGTHLYLGTTNSYRWRIDATTGWFIPEAGIALNMATQAMVNTAPTIASGGCTSPTITEANGTVAFTVTIGTSCTGVKTVTLTMPTSDFRWHCSGANSTSDAAQQTNYIEARATSTTAVVLTSYDRVTGLQEDFTASDTYLVGCMGSGS